MDFLLESIVLPLISVLFCLGFSFFLGLNGLKRLPNFGFAIGMFGLALQESSGVMFDFAPDLVHSFFWGKALFFGKILMGGGWLIFSMTFARVDKAAVFRKRLPLLKIYFFVLLSFLAVPLFEPSSLVAPKLNRLFVNRAGMAFFVLYLAVLVFVLMNLEQTFRASSGMVRYQIKYLILGVGSILGLEVYRAGQVLLFSSMIIDSMPLYSAALIICYFMVLFAVVQYRLLIVDLFVSRYVVYKSVTLLAVGAYLALVGLLILGVRRFGGEAYIRLIPIAVFAALLVLVILLLSEELRRQVQTFINIHFYKNKHDYRSRWQEFTHAVGSKLVLPELLPSLVAWLAETIGTIDSAIWLFDKEHRRYYLASRCGFSTGPATWSEEGELVRMMKAAGSALEITENNLLFQEISKESPEFFTSNPITAWIPIYSNGQMIGMFALGRKITNEHYDYHDLELLMTIADQAAGQIERVRLIEELAVVRELKAIHTLSSFFLHDLKNYTSTLSLLAQNVAKHGTNPDFQKDAFTTIQSTVDKMNQLIKHITVVGKGLVLSKSEIELNDLVDTTLSSLDGALGLKGRICSIFGDLPRFSGDADQLANVLRNLIINACNASKKEGMVTIETRAEKGRVYFSVSDEGCGMSEEFISSKLFKPLQTTRAAGWGIGLFQCQQIVKAHGGTITVESGEGLGSTFTVELPVEGR